MYVTFSAISSVASDAAYRAWGSQVSAALTTVGLTMTSDTGQVNWTTVTQPSSGNYSGYEIRQFTDSIGNPVVFKLEYGKSNNGGILFRITVGSGSNGSGTITGSVTPVTVVFGSNTGNASALPCMIASDGSYLSMGLFVSTTASQCVVFSMARTKDDSGANTSDGVNIITDPSAGGIGRSQIFYPKAGGGFSNVLSTYHCAAPPTGTGSYGTTLGQFPIFVSRGAADNPCLGALFIFTADHGGTTGAGAVIVCRQYGADHSYLYCGASGSATVNGNSNNNTIAVRYE